MAHVLEIEDHLQKVGVFIGGINGKNSHMYAYMTIIDFEKLEKITPSLKEIFSKEDWKAACKYWEHQQYLSPIVSVFLSWARNTLLVD